MGRVVITHSTYIEGLIPLLKVLAEDPLIGTITPAVISRTRGRAPRLSLRVSTPIIGGHKVNARRAGTAQEVFVLTSLDRDGLQQRLDRLLEALGHPAA
ncbi:MAG: DUF2103 domain-containing protein [Cyanobacteriota bacterium]|nr:DUF2103 domain-containing protein [Cyanobacteriota bacterium]